MSLGLVFFILLLLLWFSFRGFVKEYRSRLSLTPKFRESVKNLGNLPHERLWLKDPQTKKQVKVEEIFHYGNEYLVRAWDPYKKEPHLYRLEPNCYPSSSRFQLALSRFLQLL